MQLISEVLFAVQYIHLLNHQTPCATFKVIQRCDCRRAASLGTFDFVGYFGFGIGLSLLRLKQKMCLMIITLNYVKMGLSGADHLKGSKHAKHIVVSRVYPSRSHSVFFTYMYL